MNSYWKAFIAGMIWTALEGLAAVATVYASTIEDPVVKALIGAGIAVAIFAAKTLKNGFPQVDPSKDDDAYQNDVEPADEDMEVEADTVEDDEEDPEEDENEAELLQAN